MKKTIIILILLLQAGIAMAQNNDHQLSNEQAILAAKKLMEFDEQFDNGAPESLKKAKFDEFVDELSPELSKEDRKKAYDVVNWYIKASKGQKTEIHLSEEQQKQIEQMLKDAERKKQAGLQAAMGKVQELKNMSYSEFKAYISQNGEIPLPEADIQKAYNQLHKDDGKHVKITKQPVRNKIDNPIVAINIINNPDKHSYQEFKMALKFLKPEISEEDIQKIWKKTKKKP